MDVPYLLRRSARARGLRASVDPRRGLVVSVPPATRRGWAAPEPAVERFLAERSSWFLRHLARLDRERAEARGLGEPIDGGQLWYRGEPCRIRVLPSGPGAVEAGARRSSVQYVPATVPGAAVGAAAELVVRLVPGDRRQLRRVLGDWLRDRARDAIEVAVAVHAPVLGVRPAAVDLRDPKTRWGSASKHGRLMLSWRLVMAPPGALETVVVHELAHLRVFGHGPGFWALVAEWRPDHLADRAWLRRHSHVVHAALEDPGDAS